MEDGIDVETRIINNIKTQSLLIWYKFYDENSNDLTNKWIKCLIVIFILYEFSSTCPFVIFNDELMNDSTTTKDV